MMYFYFKNKKMERMKIMPPQCPPNTFAYMISSGDTLYSISRRYNTTVAP